jgi:hypothetical protein
MPTPNRRVIAVIAAATFTAAAAITGSAYAATEDEATCATETVTVSAKTAPVMLHPAMDAAQLFTADTGDTFECRTVRIGGKHDECGADQGNTWIILTEFDRFDAYIPASCVADEAD